MRLDVPLEKLELIAGADISYDKSTNKLYAGVLIFTYPQLELVECSQAIADATYPYIPGMLTFREGPALLEAFAKLKSEPDLLIFDGQGIAHPRGMGLAAHMGIALDKPSIGCAKTRLVGEYAEPDQAAGSFSPLMYNGQTVGVVLRTRKQVMPVFISCGHRMNLKQAIDIILACCRGYRLPEPTRQAHLYVNEVRSQKSVAIKTPYSRI